MGGGDIFRVGDKGYGDVYPIAAEADFKEAPCRGVGRLEIEGRRVALFAGSLGHDRHRGEERVDELYVLPGHFVLENVGLVAEKLADTHENCKADDEKQNELKD